jgi:hypothetical protein
VGNMRNLIFKKAIWFLLVLIIVMLVTLFACARPQISNQEKPTDTPTPTSTQNLLYDYELIYTYRNTAYDTESFTKLAGLLQSRDILTVESTSYDDDGILQINYQLKLTETEPNYKISFTKQMQDAIVLFAAFDYIKGVEFNFKQAGYTFGGVPILRADAEILLGEQIAPFGSEKTDFVEEFPSKVQAVVWEPDVMDTVNYDHAMGLDE